MIDSILKSIKKPLGLPDDYDAFDEDVLMHINSVFSTLEQLGATPKGGFLVTGETEKWADFLGDIKQAMMVKSYVYLKVRLLFDPPQTSFLLDSIQKQISEYEWRLSVMEFVFADPSTNPIPEENSRLTAIEAKLAALGIEIDEVDDDVDDVPDLDLIFDNKLV